MRNSCRKKTFCSEADLKELFPKSSTNEIPDVSFDARKEG